MQNQDAILDGKDKISYQFYYRALGTFGVVALAAFPCNVLMTFMMQRNRAFYKNKLFFAGFIQFASIMGVI
jgi:hypothetical protein